MKAITLHQPWASLIALGVKTIETRGWSTNHRGPLAIHASRSQRALDYLCWLEDHHGEAEEALLPVADGITVLHTPTGTVRARHDLPLGAVVATCKLVDCVRTERIEWMPERFDVKGQTVEWARYGVSDSVDARVAEEQRPFGDFTPGRHAWLLYDIRPLAEPIPAKGKQGLWEWVPVGTPSL